MAKALPAAPFEALGVIHEQQLGLEDAPTWPATVTLTIIDMQSPVAKHGGTLWYNDCTLSVRSGKSVVPLRVCLPVACADSMATIPRGHAGDAK